MNFKFCFFMLLAVASVAVGQEQEDATSNATSSTTQSSTTTSAPDTSTTEATTTTPRTTTTEEPTTPRTTTTEEPTTSRTTTTEEPTTPRTTTTEEPTTPRTTTTEATTTTPSTTTTEEPTTRRTTTTEEPTTPRTTTTKATTTPPATTTLPPVAPTPPPFPENVGNWSVTADGGKSPCILLSGAFQINVNRTNASSIVADVPIMNVTTTGKCESDEQEIVLDWWSPAQTGTERHNKVHFKFSKQGQEQYGLQSVKYQFSSKSKDHINITGPFFLTKLKHSFVCKSNQRIEQDNGVSYILAENLQFEAFRQDDAEIQGNPQFSDADVCKADHYTSTGVVLGIAVGIGLLIVLVISLGIYLFKRCRRGGYQPLDVDNHM